MFFFENALSGDLQINQLQQQHFAGNQATTIEIKDYQMIAREKDSFFIFVYILVCDHIRRFAPSTSPMLGMTCNYLRNNMLHCLTNPSAPAGGQRPAHQRIHGARRASAWQSLRCLTPSSHVALQNAPQVFDPKSNDVRPVI